MLTCEYHVLNLFACLAVLAIFMIHTCCSQVELFNAFSPLAACITFFGYYRSWPQEKYFQVRPGLNDLISVSQV